MTRMVKPLGGTFKTRVAPDGARSAVHPLPRVDCDFVLRMKTPSGPEEWGFDFSHQDLDISGLRRGVPSHQSSSVERRWS
jgi:hypothetical protein